MGSFANSIHVRSTSAAAVGDAVRELLRAEGYEATDEAPTGAGRGLPSPLRALHVSEARDGWVSVLDSDILGDAPALAAALSGRLGTHTLFVLVNDSDSWHYRLHHAGRLLDEFDSCDEDDEGPGGAPAGVHAADAQRVILERAAQMQQRLEERMPPELWEARRQWAQTGRVPAEQMREYGRWMQAEAANMRAELQALLGGASAARPAAPARDLRGHVAHLRPLLAPGVGEKQLLDVMGREEVFAEETLGEFLPLLGIARFYAHLSYPYLEEYTPRQLAAESVRLAEHLKFRKPSPPRGNARLRLVR